MKNQQLLNQHLLDTLNPWKRSGLEQWLRENPTKPIILACRKFSVSSWTVAALIWHMRDNPR